MKKYLLKGGQVVSSKGLYEIDVLIEGEKIKDVYDWADEIEKTLKDVEVIDCSGKMIFPGFIDVHVHFREPGHSHKEDWETASKAAASGGVTTVCDMPNNKPPIFSVKDLDDKRKMIDGRTYINYGLYMGASGDNTDEINKATNIPGVKVYICDSTGDLGVGDDALKQVFEKTDQRVVVHAEDPGILKENQKKYLAEFEGREIDPAVHSKIRSVEAATKAVQYACSLAEQYDNSLHIAHLSSAAELEIVKEYKQYGVTCEVGPHHLLLSQDDYERLGTFLRVNPPVRSRADIFEMWKGIKFGDIDMIATDHAPHTIEEKSKPYLEAPSGIPEVETTLPLMMDAVNDEGLTLPEVARLCCEKPAEVFGMKNKGRIFEGYDADIVVVDMDLEKTVDNEKLFTKCGWSPYHGRKLKGWPIMTFVLGQIVWKDGKIVGEPKGKEVTFEQPN